MVGWRSKDGWSCLKGMAKDLIVDVGLWEAKVGCTVKRSELARVAIAVVDYDCCLR